MRQLPSSLIHFLIVASDNNLMLWLDINVDFGYFVVNATNTSYAPSWVVIYLIICLDLKKCKSQVNYKHYL